VKREKLFINKQTKTMLLKNGSKGEEVKQLQTKLGTTPDGSFGPNTEKLVKEWQASNGLAADGIVGDATWSKMFGSVVTATTPITIPASAFKLDKLKGHIPDAVIAQIPDTAAKFNITNTLRLAHFLAQCGHESAGFKAVSENLNYSADGLVKIFGKYFNATTAAGSARNPEKIANKVYSSRMGNGNEASGDGWKHRGRGYIQLTGKDNYKAFDATVEDDILANPDLVATKYPLASAAFFFNKNGLWSICDRGADDATVTAVTKRVNGGTIGLADRIKHFKEYYSLLA
jgi:putative chitinase